jgi:DNA-binding CsgD family transcriptional regulator/tetratricopeptide (TPR) repeat protein
VPDVPLVGRQGELAELLRLLHDAVAGHGALAVVSGEAGLGKTRLVRELERHAQEQGVVVLSGAAVEDGPAYRPIAQALLPVLRSQSADRPLALRPYRAALGRLFPAWAVEGGDAPDRVDTDPALVLGEGILRLLDGIGDDAGCVLVVEDAHWADPDSLSLLEYLGAAVRDAPTLVVVSARDDGAGADVVRRLGATRDATVLPLASLTTLEVAELAAARAGSALPAEVTAYVVARADGLPLLVEELTESLTASGGVPVELEGRGQVPSRFVAEVARRLASLSPGARDALRAGAVLGSDPDWSLLPAVTGQDPDRLWSGLHEAVAAHLLVQQDAGLHWRHALTREAVAAGMLAPERAALARRAADALLTGGKADDEERAARLLLTAGDRSRALELALRAAVRERRRAAYGNAERLLGLADSAGGSTAVTSERVLLLSLIGRPVAALEAGAGALDAATGDDHAELSLRLARAAIDDGRWSEAEQYVARAGRPDDPRSPTLVADAAHGAGRVTEAGELAARAVALAESSGTPQQLCDALCTRGRIARLGDLAAAGEAFARAAQVAAEHGLTASRVEALFGLGTLELLDAESSTMRTARELALDLGLLSTALSSELLLCDDQLLDEGPRAVLDRVRRLVEEAGTLRQQGLRSMGGTLLALSYAATGESAAMDQELARITADRGLAPDAVAMADAARAHGALVAYDLPTADSLLDRGVPSLVEHAASAPLHVIGLWALLRTVAGNAGDGGQHARETVRATPAVQRAANRAALRYADAVAAGRAGRPDEAALLFSEADDVLRPTTWWRRVLRLVALERAVVDRWGDPVPELRANLAEHEAAGEERLAVACRDLLRRAGAPTRRGRGAGPVPAQLRAVGVTSRELDVLRFVCDGRSNAEIAERLFLSTRTVETHVAHLLAKTGTFDRNGLAAWSRERGVTSST